jgi:hypothetical protein
MDFLEYRTRSRPIFNTCWLTGTRDDDGFEANEEDEQTFDPAQGSGQSAFTSPKMSKN